MNKQFEESLILLAIEEDFGSGDHTSQASIPSDSTGKASLIIKEPGVLAGIRVAKNIFSLIDPKLKIKCLLSDGERVNIGEVAFVVSGNSRKILQAERLVLNFMQRMSGIATETSKYVTQIKGTKAKILDTRKTSPGLRHFEKEAVRIGGGMNHRMGLYDMIMIKDNHIDLSGSIELAIDGVHDYMNQKKINIPVEIEARNIDDVEKIIRHGGVDRIMLDNFNPEQTMHAVEKINSLFETESSGGISISNILDYALCGVDFISVGALTHQIHSLDMSLKVVC
ncbi:MAG: carboxylating nicotinate-nucleotide diphosphorylase [Bacteroidota bacterium]|nr:carboxylating nicotinate-nucleotide diphosphorylase [Bacteroidota bacterium]